MILLHFTTDHSHITYSLLAYCYPLSPLRYQFYNIYPRYNKIYRYNYLTPSDYGVCEKLVSFTLHTAHVCLDDVNIPYYTRTQLNISQ